MIILSYLVFGFLFGALVFGFFGVSYKRGADAHLISVLSDARRTARESLRLTVAALNRAHASTVDDIETEAQRNLDTLGGLISKLRASAEGWRMGCDIAHASIDGHERTIAALENELTERKRQIMGLHFDCEGMQDTIKDLRAKVADLGPKAVKRATWKRARRADRRALSVLAREVVSVTVRDQKIAGLQAEAFDTSARLAAVTEALDGARSLAEVGAGEVEHAQTRVEIDEWPLEYARQTLAEIARL